jgi:5'-methylthioadenosine phosphorylase
VDQFIDFTKRRPLTFFEENLAQPVHVDITYPYCAKLRGRLRATAATLGLDLADGGTYVCAEGPRFETAAEIRMFAQSGGDLVGMTQAPEVALAREAEICYASVAVVTNYAAGIAPTPLTHREVLDVMRDQLPRVRELLLAAAQAYDGEDCPCRHVLDEYRKSGAL